MISWKQFGVLLAAAAAYPAETSAAFFVAAVTIIINQANQLKSFFLNIAMLRDRQTN